MWYVLNTYYNYKNFTGFAKLVLIKTIYLDTFGIWLWSDANNYDINDNILGFLRVKT